MYYAKYQKEVAVYIIYMFPMRPSSQKSLSLLLMSDRNLVMMVSPSYDIDTGHIAARFNKCR